MCKGWRPRLLSILVLALLTMAVPRKASAYVDPGSGALIWQMAAAALIGSLFYVRRVVGWVRTRLKLRSARAMGFLFACCYALVASPLTLEVFHAHPLPRFNDIFLVGIVLTAYLFAWEPAVFLLVISLLVSAWVLPSGGSLWAAGFTDWYRLVSFAAVSVFLICLITRMKSRYPSPTANGAAEMQPPSMAARG